MNTICSYCNKMFDIRFLTIHTILAHHIHEEPSYREFKLIDNYPDIYYSIKFLFDNDYNNTAYNYEINKQIIDAIFKNDISVDVEFIENNKLMYHHIDLRTMKITNNNGKATCCYNCYVPEQDYELVVLFDKEFVYRSVLINNCSDQLYPLRTEYFKYISACRYLYDK